MSVLMEARGLEKSFRTDHVERAVLCGLSLAVDRGEWVAAMGPSGCGKSTMLHLLGGLDLPDAGSVRLGDDEITTLSNSDRARLRRRRVGYVFQQYNLIPHLDVAANVEMPQRLAGASRRDARARSVELLDALGLEDRESDRQPSRPAARRRTDRRARQRVGRARPRPAARPARAWPDHRHGHPRP
jgi:ABC-type lipoprotein export system ATPase subunit